MSDERVELEALDSCDVDGLAIRLAQQRERLSKWRGIALGAGGFALFVLALAVWQMFATSWVCERLDQMRHEAARVQAELRQARQALERDRKAAEDSSLECMATLRGLEQFEWREKRRYRNAEIRRAEEERSAGKAFFDWPNKEAGAPTGGDPPGHKPGCPFLNGPRNYQSKDVTYPDLPKQK